MAIEDGEMILLVQKSRRSITVGSFRYFDSLKDLTAFFERETTINRRNYFAYYVYNDGTEPRILNKKEMLKAGLRGNRPLVGSDEEE